MKVLPLFGAAVLIGGVPCSWAGRNVGQGPLVNAYATPSRLMQAPPAVHFVSSRLPGIWRVELGVVWGTVWNVDHGDGHYFIDGEWVVTFLAASRALGERWRIGGRLPVVARTGGFADRLIEGFHDLFGFGNFHRKEYARNRVVVEYDDAHGHRRRFRGDDCGTGDMELFAACLLTEGTALRPAAEGYGIVTLPTGEPESLRGLGAVQAGGGVRLAKRIGRSRWYTYLDLRTLYWFADEMAGVELHRWHGSISAAAEYAWTPAFSVLGQLELTSPVARQFHDFSDPIWEGLLGVKWMTGRTSRMELSFVENMFNYDNSSDIALRLSWTAGF